MIRTMSCFRYVGLAVTLAAGLTTSGAQAEHPTSYAPVAITEDFATIMNRMKAAKPEVTQQHQQLLEQRYDLSNRPAAGVTMSRGKPVQEGVRVKLPAGTTWDSLAKMTPDDIREKGVFSKRATGGPFRCRPAHRGSHLWQHRHSGRSAPL